MSACSNLDDNGDNDHLTPPRKKTKSPQKYKNSYYNQWLCLHSSQKVEYMVHCSVCKTDFSCKYADKNESKVHQQLLKTRKSNMSMTSFVAKSSTEVEQQRSITRLRLCVKSFLGLTCLKQRLTFLKL